MAPPVAEMLRALLYGQEVAEVRRDGRKLTLRYNAGYRRASTSTPISLSMPVLVEEHGTATLEPWLWGLLPDNQDVLTRWGKDYQVSARNVFQLLEHVGGDCAGAVQFVPDGVTDPRAGGSVTWLSEAGVAQRLRQLRADPTAWHTSNATGQFSLAGAQAKTALHFAGGRWGVPTGRIPTTHILKPAVEGYSDHDLNEHLCLRTARNLGLAAAVSEVRLFEEERAVVVERYDRLETDDGYLRVHQEDLCQALSIHPDSKYQAEGGPSPARIARLFRESVGRSLALRLTSDFVDAMALNWIIAGTDAHAKNYSLLLSGRDVRLAPLYDLASALPYEDVDRHRLRLAMKVGRSYELAFIGRENWEQLAEEVGLVPAAVVARVRELARATPGALAQAVAEDGVRTFDSRLPDLLLTEVTARAAACVSRLTRHPLPRGRTTEPGGSTGPGSWTPVAAAMLLAELAPPQVALLARLTHDGGRSTADTVRAALGRAPGSTLRGLTGPVTRAVGRLIRRGVLGPDMTSPVRATYDGSVKATHFVLEPAALGPLVQALADHRDLESDGATDPEEPVGRRRGPHPSDR